MTDLRILPEVSADLSEAASWYDQEGYVGLGDRFVATFYSYVSHLRQSGEIYKTVYSEFRRVLLRPFPYALYYRYSMGSANAGILHSNEPKVSIQITRASSNRTKRRAPARSCGRSEKGSDSLPPVLGPRS